MTVRPGDVIRAMIPLEGRINNPCGEMIAASVIVVSASPSRYLGGGLGQWVTACVPSTARIYRIFVDD